ncbi:MAG: ABC transporter ATP-binding protein [Oligoflexia bacterium]|nr:MAG: ABC transporter ATP-binding protein [Oligoflexia bacterium]
MSLLISAVQLSKSFAGKKLFHGISFGISENERVGFLGPNGVGKSTLMQILAKKIPQDSGEVVATKGLRIGYLEQSPKFPANATICSFLLHNHEIDPDLMAKAYEWIGRLELSQFDEQTPIASLSGGWQKKVALAHELMRTPDLLFLDEPTNHLDVESIKWLEDFLSQAKFSCFFITHDRLFLQRVANRIIDLDPRFPGFLLSVNAGYDQYLESKAEMISNQEIRETKLKNLLRREKEWLARGAQARQTKQKARIENAGKLASHVEDLTDRNRQRKLNLEFEAQEKNPTRLIECIKVSKKFGDKWVFRDLNLMITPKTRLALMGVNGAGKSTLIRVLLGLEAPTSGQVKIAENLKSAYFEQGRDALKQEESVLKNICPFGDYVQYRNQSVHARSYLERFHFYKNQVDLPVKQLSGGEQARLRIAQLMLREAQILILDEPTNDLDIDTLNSLQESLEDFPGAVILVTHDRFFMDQIAKQILAFSPFENDQNQLIPFADYLQWEKWFDEKTELVQSGGDNQQAGDSQGIAHQGSKSDSRKLSYKEKIEFEKMEEVITQKEVRLAQIENEIEDPHIASQADKVQGLYAEMSGLQQEIARLYSRWAELEEKVKI